MILERGLKLALAERDEALRELATATDWVDRSAFKVGASFAQAHQALLKALEKAGRCLAPDLLGMGQSGKSPSGAYRFVDHARYLDAWFEALDLTRDITLVIHDWGSALGFHRATRYPAQIRAIAYMEAIAMPMGWEDFGEAADSFRALRSEAGETMIMDQHAFVETILPQGILRKLTGKEMDSYRAPFLEREARLPTLVWPRQIPVEGEPAEVTAIAEEYGRAMTLSSLPKLLIAGDPGLVIKGRILEFCRTWPNQTEIRVKGAHFLQEDSPQEIGTALRDFVQSLS